MKFTEIYKCAEDYVEAKVLAIEPMTAKEPLNTEELDMMLTSEDYIAEEKKDGTRGILHLRLEGARLFSRRISKKTGWYAENSDSVPHIRDMFIPSNLLGTVLDGELSLDNGGFNDISGLMNCLPEEAISRQEKLGSYVVFNAFDIVYYKGVYIAKMPLIKRKQYLKKVITELNSIHIREEYYTDTWKPVTMTPEIYKLYKEQGGEATFPGIADCLGTFHTETMTSKLRLTKRAWYEYIVMNGGEGLMLKPKSGTYKHRRGREYTKYKKFTTRECVILGYGEPTKEYEGKELSTWQYWQDNVTGDLIDLNVDSLHSPMKCDNYTPISKHYFKGWIGTIIYGVAITQEELNKLIKSNPKEKYLTQEVEGQLYLNVGESSGFDECTRGFITDNKDTLIGSVIELKCHEVIKKTGKLRHPRFLRFRYDKEAESCTWVDHIGGN